MTKSHFDDNGLSDMVCFEILTFSVLSALCDGLQNRPSTLHDDLLPAHRHLRQFSVQRKTMKEFCSLRKLVSYSAHKHFPCESLSRG